MKMRVEFEVFNPIDGKAYYVTRFALIAHFVAWMTGGDFAPEGEGWTA